MLKRLMCFVTLGILFLTSAAIAKNVEYYFKFPYSSQKELTRLTRLISIDNVKDGMVYAYANQKQFDNFKTLGYDYEVLPAPSTLFQPNMTDDKDLVLDWDYYPTYTAYLTLMYEFEDDYPDLCDVMNIGYTVEGRQLLYAKISANVDIEESEPEVNYTSTMHGDETTGYILMLHLIDYLLSNYGSDSQVTTLLDNTEVWINPNANPDGTYAGGNNTVWSATRANSNGVDLNRNFPDPDDGQHPDGNEWQPETVAMLDFAADRNFVIAANIHGGAEVANYPWDTWSRLTADNDWWMLVCREYADSAQANSPSGYMTDLNNGITNGYAWYTITGGRQDCFNYWYGCREVTLEISHTKTPPESDLEDYWDYNRAALITYLEQCYYGIRGEVTDSQTGLPVAAIVSAVGHDQDSSEVYTDPDHGNYYRMIYPGTYSLCFTATGYVPQTIDNVTVTSRGTTYLDVQLVPLSTDTLTIVTETLPDWTIDYPYSQQLEATGGSGELSWSDYDDGLADFGLALSDTGVVVGTPSQTGEVSFTARVTDDIGAYDDQQFEFTINAAVEILTDSLPSGIVNEEYEYQLEATGGTGSLTWMDLEGDLDGTGLTLSTDGLLAGTYSSTVDLTFVAVATDDIGAADEQYLTLSFEADFLPGDANGDNLVIGSDVTYLVQYFRGNNPAPDPFYAGDANGDCLVIGADVTYLVQYFRGLGSPPQIGDCPPAVSKLIIR